MLTIANTYVYIVYPLQAAVTVLNKSVYLSKFVCISIFNHIVAN